MQNEISWLAVPGKLELRWTLYVDAPPRRVWRALTDPRMTPKYYYGLRLRARLRRGGEFCYTGASGKGDPMILGRILRIDPGRRLVTTYSIAKLSDRPSVVTFEVSPFGRVTRLAFRHTGFQGRSTTFRWVCGGWAWILSGLKTLVESGKPLRA